MRNCAFIVALLLFTTACGGKAEKSSEVERLAEKTESGNGEDTGEKDYLPLFSATERSEDASIVMPRAPLPAHCGPDTDPVRFCTAPYPLFLERRRYDSLAIRWGVRKTAVSHVRKLFQQERFEFILSLQAGSEPPMIWLDPYADRTFRIFPVRPELSQLQVIAQSSSVPRFRALSNDTAEIEFTDEHVPPLSRFDIRWNEQGNFSFHFVPPALPLSVVIDPGHGGTDHGAVSEGLTESELNLEAATILADSFRAKGAQVTLTRTDDSKVSLVDRLAAARKPGVALFISVHQDDSQYALGDVRPFCYYSRYDVSELCRAVSQAVARQYPEKVSYTKRYLYVLQGYDNPSILLEVLNLNDARHRTVLESVDRRKEFYARWADAVSATALAELDRAARR